jgi:hypothetical protein
VEPEAKAEARQNGERKENEDYGQPVLLNPIPKAPVEIMAFPGECQFYTRMARGPNFLYNGFSNVLKIVDSIGEPKGLGDKFMQTLIPGSIQTDANK